MIKQVSYETPVGTLPALSVTGVTKAHAQRAIKWMRARSFAAFYHAEDKSLNAFEFKDGSKQTYHVLREALEMTRKPATPTYEELRQAFSDCLDDLLTWAGSNPEGFTPAELKRTRAYVKLLEKA